MTGNRDLFVYDDPLNESAESMDEEITTEAEPGSDIQPEDDVSPKQGSDRPGKKKRGSPGDAEIPGVPKMKDILFNAMCIAGCVAGIAIVGLCVASAAGSMNGNKAGNSQVYVNGSRDITELRAYYKGNSLYIDVYLRPELESVYINDKDVTESLYDKTSYEVDVMPLDPSPETLVPMEDDTDISTEDDGPVTLPFPESDRPVTEIPEETEQESDDEETEDIVTEEPAEQTDQKSEDKDLSDKRPVSDAMFAIGSARIDGTTELLLLSNFESNGYMDTDTIYTVQRGDTLTKLSHMTGFSVDFLAAYNRLVDKNLIITGESLRYPTL